MPTGPKQRHGAHGVGTVKPVTPQSQLSSIAARWQTIKRQAVDLTAQEKNVNKQISQMVEELGEPDEKGHIWVQGLSFPGYEKDKPVIFNALQRQRRVSVFMDEEEAARILEKKGRLEEASVSYIQVTDVDKAMQALRDAGLLDSDSGIEVTTSISEDKVRDLYYDEALTEEEYNEIFTEKVTWALLPGRL